MLSPLTLERLSSESHTVGLDLPPQFPELPEDYLPNNVSVHFHLSSHVTASDLDGFHEVADRTDVFAVEYPGWHEKTQQKFNAVSKGNYKTYQKMLAEQKGRKFAEYKIELLTILKGSYSPVLFIDANKEEYEPQDLALYGLSEKSQAAEADNYLETLDNYARLYAEMAIRPRKRDIIMINRLGSAVTQTVVTHPKLKDKDTVQVSIALGSLHRPVYDHLAASPATVSKVTANINHTVLPVPAEGIMHEYLDTGTIRYESLMEALIFQGMNIAFPSNTRQVLEQLGPAGMEIFKRATSAQMQILRSTGDDAFLIFANRAARNELDENEKQEFKDQFLALANMSN